MFLVREHSQIEGLSERLRNSAFSVVYDIVKK